MSAPALDSTIVVGASRGLGCPIAVALARNAGPVVAVARDPAALAEWAYRQVFTSNDERAAALAPWIEHYNTRRRHSALAALPPISRLVPT
jgi:transposase InsO family protein